MLKSHHAIGLPTLHCTPDTPETPINQKTSIHLENLTPTQVVEIRVETKDSQRVKWCSSAQFQIDERGCVFVDTQAPLVGSYEGVDGMGLFWSIRPITNEYKMFQCKDDQLILDITVYIENKLILNKTIIRYLKYPSIKQIVVKEEGLIGKLFIPYSVKPLPLIITLTGSGGGFSESRAKLLASNGFATFALGYFGAEGLPPNLQEIPLEYFGKTFNWLKSQSFIDSSRIGIYGCSRGAELALILGSIFPNSIQSIVAVVPSSVIYPALGETNTHAWLYHGKPIAPFAPGPTWKSLIGSKGKDPTDPINTTEIALKSMQDLSNYDDATILVEKIRCPILLISGGDDQMWPSAIYAEQIRERLKEKGGINCCHLNYPKAGHNISIPNLPNFGPIIFHPIAKLWFSVGGAAIDDQQASLDSWTKLVEFFHESLMWTEK